eukprot:CAMPEP_0114493624 /NCGR_PEP_ID=MMETSP0109-20121206/4207_1 /TAXON_ID=29199 /ORGANISM="Chlorarachnion reptans, Strain CCCM449" /LENGTH=109 /DNA_ID=CAMNT_0001670585 /DNA_START=309 /DNA_END=638 /DNA_ORIENTATION=+
MEDYKREAESKSGVESEHSRNDVISRPEIKLPAYGSFQGGRFQDSRENIAGFLKYEYRRRVRSPLDAGITVVLVATLLGALIVGVVRPLLNHDSPLNTPLVQMFASTGG